MYVSPRALLIAGTATVLISGGTGALATVLASPVGKGGTIHGCYAVRAVHGSHALVLQNAGTSCRAGYTAVKWNEEGPAGPRGPAGGLSSLGELNGIPCNKGTGTTQVSYGRGGSVTLTCVGATPTATPTPTPTPTPTGPTQPVPTPS